MSDRSSNLEIQDVLSSIRRLVSEDRHHVRPADAVMPDAPSANKLVLTSAQRVDETPPEAGHPDERPDSGRTSLEDTIAELEAAVAGIGEDFEPDGSEVAKAGRSDADPDLERAFEDSFAVDVGDDETESDLSRPVTSSQLDDGAETAASEAAMGAPASAETADVTTPTATGGAASDAPERDDADADDGRLATQVAAATAAAVGADVTRRLNLTTGDMVREGSAPWGRLDAPERDEAQTGPAPRPQPEKDATGAVFRDVEAEADAEILREIVADIVKQELQGPLGERITRSVRMLVRREINRALASRGIE